MTCKAIFFLPAKIRPIRGRFWTLVLEKGIFVISIYLGFKKQGQLQLEGSYIFLAHQHARLEGAQEDPGGMKTPRGVKRAKGHWDDVELTKYIKCINKRKFILWDSQSLLSNAFN